MLRPRSASLAHLARSSAASNGLLNPVWRSRLAPLRSSAPKPAPELYTPSKPVGTPCDDLASSSKRLTSSRAVTTSRLTSSRVIFSKNIFA